MFLRSAGSMVMAANIRYQTRDQNPRWRTQKTTSKPRCITLRGKVIETWHWCHIQCSQCRWVQLW